MLAELPLQGATVVLRRAAVEDVPAIVALLAADQLGETRDGINAEEDLQPYLTAFAIIDADPTHLLLVATDTTQIVATMQFSVIPGLARRGRSGRRSKPYGCGTTTAAAASGLCCSSGGSRKPAVATALSSS